MDRLKPCGNNPDKYFIRCDEFEHELLDTSNQRMVKSSVESGGLDTWLERDAKTV